MVGLEADQMVSSAGSGAAQPQHDWVNRQAMAACAERLFDQSRRDFL
jgi:hypothetical protein